MLITTEHKDEILKSLLSLDPGISTSFKHLDYLKKWNIDLPSFIALLNYFERQGLISELGINFMQTTLVINVEAHDFVRRGGFKVQEEMIQKNIEKLLLEIESLKPNNLEQAGRIAGISSAILTGLGLLISGK